MKRLLLGKCLVPRNNNFIKNSNVSTWSPLATAFNTRPGRKLNLSLSRDNTVSLNRTGCLIFYKMHFNFL